MSNILFFTRQGVLADLVRSGLRQSCEVTEVPMERSSRADRQSAAEATSQRPDIVLFIGDACRSSWTTADNHFECEHAFLDTALRAAADADARFVYVTGDSVFSGPELFHGEDCAKTDAIDAAALIRFEEQVVRYRRSVIIRTHVIEPDCPGVNNLISSLRNGIPVSVTALQYAAPSSCAAFASRLAALLPTLNDSEILHLAGAERSTFFQFACMAARELGADHRMLQPDCSGGIRECSLLSEQATHRIGIKPPMLGDCVAEAASMAPDYAAEIPIAA